MPSATGLPGRSFAVPSGATGIIRPVAQISKQQHTNWCWAAVITSIVKSKANPPVPTYTQQCAFAATVLGSQYSVSQDDCCGPAAESTCNVALTPDWIAGTGGVTSPLATAGLSTQPPDRSDSRIDDATIKTALQEGRPTCLVIARDSGDKHFVAIVGAYTDGGTQKYLIGDPADGAINGYDRASIQHYAEYTGPGGNWTDSYVTV